MSYGLHIKQDGTMDEREMFERYAHQMGKRDFEQNEFGDYRNPFTQEPWNFWRASREALQAGRRTTPDREATVRAGEDVVVTNIPNRIYLNLGDIYEMGELPFQQLTDVTWCEDRIDDTDIEYVRVAAPTSDKGGA